MARDAALWLTPGQQDEWVDSKKQVGAADSSEGATQRRHRPAAFSECEQLLKAAASIVRIAAKVSTFLLFPLPPPPQVAFHIFASFIAWTIISRVSMRILNRKAKPIKDPGNQALLRYG
jgi:hypothetical protein